MENSIDFIKGKPELRISSFLMVYYTSENVRKVFMFYSEVYFRLRKISDALLFYIFQTVRPPI